MLGNAVWFGTLSTTGAAPINVFGVFSVTWPEIFMGLLINLITFPFVFLVVFLFKFSKPSKLRSNTVEKSLKEGKEVDTEESDDEDDGTESDEGSMGMAEDSDIADEDIKSMTSHDSSRTVSSVESLGSFVTRSKFSLPHFCLYIGWFLCFAFIVLSAFFLWAYGITFGNEFILTWFTTVVISFFTSFFIFEPLKVAMTDVCLGAPTKIVYPSGVDVRHDLLTSLQNRP